MRSIVRSKVRVLQVLAANCVLVTATAPAQTMENINVFGSPYVQGTGVSPDGAVTVGYGLVTSGELHAFRYDLENGVVDLGTFGGVRSIANGVSAYGNVIVGYSMTAAGQDHAFRYDLISGMTDLGVLRVGGTSIASAVSADGSVIVGYGHSVAGPLHAFIYAKGAITDLGTLSGRGTSFALGVSEEGTVIVGQTHTDSGKMHAFSYTGGVMTDIGTLNGSGTSFASGVSANGAVIVGNSDTGLGQFHAFRYASGVMTDLGTLGGANSEATGVSANGGVIVGFSGIADNTATRAFKVVAGVMTDLGTLGGTSSFATVVSANGDVIVGSSETANGETHAFIYRQVFAEGSNPFPALIDVPNTYAALAINAGRLAGLLNARHAVLGFALHDECNSYSVRNVCVSAGGRNSRVEGGFADTAAQLQLGYRLSPQWRIGGSLDQGISTSTPGNYVVNRSQPLVALYAAYSPTGTPAGLQLKVSVAQGSDDVGITRSVLANTEAGHGNSALTAKGVQLEAGWGWTFGSWQAMSFAGAKDTRLSRGAYAESSGTDFPVSYQAVRQSATTAYAGVQASSALGTNLIVSLRGGVEQDLHRNQDPYVGTIKFLGPFAVAAPTVQRTRGFVSISGAYRLTPTQQLSVGVHYSQQPLQDANGVTVALRYTAAL